MMKCVLRGTFQASEAQTYHDSRKKRRRAKAKTFRREGFRRFLELSLVHPAELCCHVKPPENCKTEKKALSIHLAGFEPAQGIAYCRWGMTHMHSNLATRTQDPPLVYESQQSPRSSCFRTF